MGSKQSETEIAISMCGLSHYLYRLAVSEINEGCNGLTKACAFIHASKTSIEIVEMHVLYHSDNRDSIQLLITTTAGKAVFFLILFHFGLVNKPKKIRYGY